ncbi:MAG: cyclic nucleotide-binding domain-containing protein [Actinomycetota bacterium]
MTRLRSFSVGTLAGAGSLALFEVGMAVSLAALVAQGVTDDVLPRLIGVFLLSAAFGIVAIGLRASVPGTVSSLQDTTAVVVAGVMASLVADVADDQQLATVLVFVALSGLVTGLVLLGLGVFGLGEIVRYLPAPVMSGFRLGTGWLLLLGGVEVAIGRSVDTDLFSGAGGGSLVLALLVGLIVVVTGESESPPYVLSAAVLSAIGAFFAIGALVSSIDQLEIDGWFLGPFSRDPSLRPLTDELGDVDWDAIVGQAPAIAAVAFIAVTGLLLNTGAIEADLDVEADVDADLRSTGLTNVVLGAAGSSPVYVMYSGTLLGHRLGLTRRHHLVPVGAVMVAAFLIGSSVAGYTPRFVAGGFLIGVGVSIAFGWLMEQRSRAIGDLLATLAIAVVIGAVGVLEGVAFGIVLAVAIFVRRYSLLVPAGRVRSLAVAPSRRDRPQAETDALAAVADRTKVIELNGFLFFGSVVRVRRQIRDLLDADLRSLVLDFTTVAGIDESAEIQLRQLLARLTAHGVDVHLSGAAGAALLVDGVRHHRDLDHAVEAAEDALLAQVGPLEPVEAEDELTALLAGLPTTVIPAGTDLFVSGEIADGFVLVESGAVGVFIEGTDGRPIRLRLVGPGSLLGELGYATGAPRSARATAEVDTVVRRVDADVFADRDSAFAAELNRLVLAHVAARLAATNEIVRSLSR